MVTNVWGPEEKRVAFTLTTCWRCQKPLALSPGVGVGGILWVGVLGRTIIGLFLAENLVRYLWGTTTAVSFALPVTCGVMAVMVMDKVG